MTPNKSPPRHSRLVNTRMGPGVRSIIISWYLRRCINVHFLPHISKQKILIHCVSPFPALMPFPYKPAQSRRRTDILQLVDRPPPNSEVFVRRPLSRKPIRRPMLQLWPPTLIFLVDYLPTRVHHIREEKYLLMRSNLIQPQ